MIRETLSKRLLTLIGERPNLTQQQLAEALWGKDADCRRLIADIRCLLQLQMIDRGGCGGRHDPYKYRLWSRAL